MNWHEAVLKFSGWISPTTFGVVTRMTTVRAQRRCCVDGVKKSLGIPKTFTINVSFSREEGA